MREPSFQHSIGQNIIIPTLTYNLARIRQRFSNEYNSGYPFRTFRYFASSDDRTVTRIVTLIDTLLSSIRSFFRVELSFNWSESSIWSIIDRVFTIVRAGTASCTFAGNFIGGDLYHSMGKGKYSRGGKMNVEWHALPTAMNAVFVKRRWHDSQGSTTSRSEQTRKRRSVKYNLRPRYRSVRRWYVTSPGILLFLAFS